MNSAKRLILLLVATFVMGVCMFAGQLPKQAVADGVCYSSTPVPTPEPVISFLHSCTGTTVIIPGPLPTATGTSPATISTPAGSATSITLLAANPARNGYSVCNDSSAILYMAKAATASATAYSVVFPPTSTTAYCYIEMGVGIYKGIITGIWASATGNARVTEW